MPIVNELIQAAPSPPDPPRGEDFYDLHDVAGHRRRGHCSPPPLLRGERGDDVRCP